MLVIIACACCAVAADARADDRGASREAALWTGTVQIDDKTLLVTAVSKSGDALEDDMEITIVQDDEKVPVPVRKAMYEPAKASSDQRIYSEVLPVFKIGPHELLLILTENARPGYPYTTLVAYDYLARKVTDVKERIASFKQESLHARYAFVSYGPGRYRLRLIREHLDISDGPEAHIEAWMVIRYVKGRLECAWQ